MPLLSFEPLSAPPARTWWDRPRVRYGAALILGLCLMWAAAFASLVLRTQDWQSFVTELGTYATGVALFSAAVWRRRPRGAERALALFVIWAATSLAVNMLTKLGLELHMLSTPAATDPRSAWGLLFALPPLALLYLARNDEDLQRAGLRLDNFGGMVFVGVLFGALMGLHLLTTVRFSGVTELSVKPWPYMLWSFGYELYQSLAEELFFRGLMMRALQQVFKLNFWPSLLLMTVANVSIYVIKTSWRSPLNFAGLMIYLSLSAITTAFLYRRFNSIVPCWACNMTFSLLSTLRGE